MRYQKSLAAFMLMSSLATSGENRYSTYPHDPNEPYQLKDGQRWAVKKKRKSKKRKRK